MTTSAAPVQTEQEDIASEVIENRVGRIYVLKSGITVVRIKPKAKQELADAKENVGIVRRLNKGVRRPLLVDIRDPGETGAGVRAEYAQTAEVNAAIALLVSSSLSRMIANFFISMNRPPVPTQLFTDERAAMQWLKGYLPR